MQIRRGCPDIPQRRDVDPAQGAAKSGTALGPDRADVLRVIAAAVGESRSAMAARAVLRDEHVAPGKPGSRQAAVTIAVRARRESAERRDIRGERVEIGADARLLVAERLAARTRVELRISHEPGAVREVPDLLLEILDLIEVVAPV